MNKPQYTICDLCQNYNGNASQTRNWCDDRTIDKNYFDERENGNKKTCKGFQRLHTVKQLKELHEN